MWKMISELEGLVNKYERDYVILNQISNYQ